MKTLKKLLAVCLMLCVVFAVAACSHEHEISTDWVSDENGHWHVCLDEECALETEVLAHVFDAGKVTTPSTETEQGVKTYSCMVCGYQKTEAIAKLPHKHVLTKTEAVEPTCSAEGAEAYYTCSVCKLIFSDAEGENAIQVPVVIEKLPHTDAANDHVCDVCNGRTGIHQAGEGSHECAYCGETMSECNDADQDHNCDTCDAVLSYCEGEGHTCDYCGEPISECVDEEYPIDHKCDICGGQVGEHVEAEGSHYCDHCGQLVSTCVDADKDHECDICGTKMGAHKPATGGHHCEYCGFKFTECTPAEDDGDCTTAILCTKCGDVVVAGADAHTPEADDGDCTTDVGCSVCDKVAIKGAASHTPEADDGDCTTDVGCSVCDKVAIKGAASHTPEADDGDCTTDIKCSVCGTVTTEGADAHTIATGVKENIVAPTSGVAGSYDFVGYCSACGKDAKNNVTLPAFNGTDYNFAVATKADATGAITITYTLKADESFTYTQEYTSFLQIDDIFYVEDTLDAVSIDGATVTYANDCFNFAASKTVNLTTLLAYGPAPVVITGDVVLTRGSRLNNNGGLFIGTETAVGNLTVVVTANADGMKLWNTHAHLNVVNGTFTVNGNSSTYSSNKAAMWIDKSHSMGKITVGPKGNLDFTNYKHCIGGYGTLTIQNDISIIGLGGSSISIADGVTVTAGAISCTGNITGNGDIIIDGSIVTAYAASSVAGTLTCDTLTVRGGETLTITTFTSNLKYADCKDESAEFGFNHPLKIEDGTLNAAGKITSVGVKVGSLLNNGTKGYIVVNANSDVFVTATGQGLRLDFANGAGTFTSSQKNMTKSLIMINKDVEVNINIMKDCVLTANYYEYVFYSSNAKNTTKTLSYCDGSLVVNECKYVCRPEVKIVRTADDKTITPTAAKLAEDGGKVYYVVSCNSDYRTLEEFVANMKIQIRTNNGTDLIYRTEADAEIVSFDTATGAATFRIDVTDLEQTQYAYYVRFGEKDHIVKDGVADFNTIDVSAADTTPITIGNKTYVIVYAKGAGKNVNGYGTVALQVTNNG